MRFAVPVSVAVVVLLCSGIAAGQPVLERLEQQIRGRVNPPVAGGGPTTRGVPQVAPAPRPAASTKKSESGYLGAVVDDKNDRGRGVRVLDLRPAGPAEKAGLRKNDLINGAAGIRVRQMSDLGDVVVLFGPGDTITFDVLRDGRQQQINVKLGRRPATQPEIVPLPPVQTGTPPGTSTADVPMLNAPSPVGPQPSTPASDKPKSTAQTLAGLFAQTLKGSEKPKEKPPVVEPPKIAAEGSKAPASAAQALGGLLAQTLGAKPKAANPKLPPNEPKASTPPPLKAPKPTGEIFKPPLEPVKSADDAATIRQLRQRVDQLERRVAELERALKSQRK